MEKEITHKLTPLAILVVFVLTIPGLFLGQILALLYGLLIGTYLQGNLIDWVTNGWMSTLLKAVVPNVISGLVGGMIGIVLAFKIKYLRQANYEIAAYAVSAIALTITVLSLFFLFHSEGMSVRMIESLSNVLGIVFGLFSQQSSIRQEQRKAVSA